MIGGVTMFSKQELQTMNDFLTLVDVWGDAAIEEQLVILAAKRHKKEPRILKWTPEDLDILRAEYPKHGTYIPELRSRFTPKQITNRANELGIYKKTSRIRNHWKDYQLRLLEEKYPVKGTEIPELLVNFSRQQIIARAYRMGIHKLNNWSPYEEELLRSKYAENGTQIPELLKNHSVAAIAARASLLGLHCTNKRCWCKEDKELLLTCFPKLGAEIPELRTKYSVKEIKTKALSLGIVVPRRAKCTFTEEEISILIQDYPKYGTEIPELTRRHSEAAIRQKANKLGLHYDASIFKRTQTFG